MAMSFGEKQELLRRPIELHIEKLVLNGFQPRDRYRIGEAVQSELSRLLTEQGIASTFEQSISIDRLKAGNLSISLGMSALNQGNQMARLVYRTFERVNKQPSARSKQTRRPS
jgi:hypothetical protein